MPASWRCLRARVCRGGFILVCLLVLLEGPRERAVALEFRVPKDGRHYDTSEMVYVFEREADEDGYPVLEVDGQRVRAFDFKAMEYEISMMGQQVGQHSAVVRLMEFAEGDEEAAEGNRELANASVTYSIADPGSGINFMRSSLAGDGSVDAEAADEAHERGQAMIANAMRLLRAHESGDKPSEATHTDAARLFRDAAALVPDVRRRRYSAALVEALLQASSLGLTLHRVFLADPASPSASPSSLSSETPASTAEEATADVLTSKDSSEACAGHEHALEEFARRIQPQNPYLDFDASGLEYTAGEHQGHDQGLMAALIHVLSPQLIIEVGSWKGGSAIQMASVVRRRGWGCATKILCVDTWLGTATDLKANRRALRNGFPTVYKEFMHNVMSAGLSSVVVPLPAPANIAAKFLGYLLDKDEMPTADLVFIDGNHDYDDVKADISNYFPFLSPGGVMFGDDFGWAGVKKAVYEFAGRHNLTVLSPGGRTWMMA